MKNYYKLGCIWDAKSQQWESYFDILKKYKLVIGDEERFQIGDIVAIAEGFSVRAIGIVQSQPCILENSNYESDFKPCIPEKEYSWIHYYHVEWIDISNDIIWYKTQRGWVQILQEDIIRQINNKIIKYQNNKMENTIIDLLLANKNLILTGAPGVGKTYKTAEIAVAICDGADKIPNNRSDLTGRYKKLIENGQIAFTTFHQSLDYEEFVEGLKPDVGEDGQGTGSYSVKSGIFKRICDISKNSKYSGSTDNFDELWNKLIEQVRTKLPELTKIGKWNYGLSNQNSLKYSSINTPSSYTFTITKDNVYSAYKGRQARNSGAFQKDMEDVVAYMKGEFGLKDYVMDNISENEKYKNYVLIIDEINRGNISKIFGELITLLEKDKRLDDKLEKDKRTGDENGMTVTLPYSQETFGVPSNLYVIGTMNTADRSIGSIDYALRRRFAFYPLKADKAVISTYDQYGGDTKIKAEQLFDKIQKFINENINEDLDADDLMVGHSYFLCETEDDLKRRLEYAIIPLLREYQKDGILSCERKILKDKIEEWKNL